MLNGYRSTFAASAYKRVENPRVGWKSPQIFEISPNFCLQVWFPQLHFKTKPTPLKQKQPYVVIFLMHLNSTAVIAVERQKLKPFSLITIYAEERLFVTFILFLGNSIAT